MHILKKNSQSLKNIFQEATTLTLCLKLLKSSTILLFCESKKIATNSFHLPWLPISTLSTSITALHKTISLVNPPICCLPTVYCFCCCHRPLAALNTNLQSFFSHGQHICNTCHKAPRFSDFGSFFFQVFWLSLPASH